MFANSEFYHAHLRSIETRQTLNAKPASKQTILNETKPVLPEKERPPLRPSSSSLALPPPQHRFNRNHYARRLNIFSEVLGNGVHVLVAPSAEVHENDLIRRHSLRHLPHQSHTRVKKIKQSGKQRDQGKYLAWGGEARAASVSHTFLAASTTTALRTQPSTQIHGSHIRSRLNDSSIGKFIKRT